MRCAPDSLARAHELALQLLLDLCLSGAASADEGMLYVAAAGGLAIMLQLYLVRDSADVATVVHAACSLIHSLVSRSSHSTATCCFDGPAATQQAADSSDSGTPGSAGEGRPGSSSAAGPAPQHWPLLTQLGPLVDRVLDAGGGSSQAQVLLLSALHTYLRFAEPAVLVGGRATLLRLLPLVGHDSERLRQHAVPLLDLLLRRPAILLEAFGKPGANSSLQAAQLAAASAAASDGSGVVLCAVICEVRIAICNWAICLVLQICVDACAQSSVPRSLHWV